MTWTTLSLSVIVLVTSTGAGSVDPATPALVRDVNSEQEPLICVGIYTSEEFPQKCKCSAACHTCDYNGSTPGTCMRCRDRTYLLHGHCVGGDQCRQAGGTLRGTGSFDRICYGASRVTVNTTRPSSKPACKGLAMLRGNRCVCWSGSRRTISACEGEDCTSAWVRGTIAPGRASNSPEYYTGYDPRKCPDCSCKIVKPTRGLLKRVQATFKTSLVQRLRKLAPSCAYVFRYLALRRAPANNDLWSVTGTSAGDLARLRGPHYIIPGVQKGGTSHLFAALTSAPPFAAPRVEFDSSRAVDAKELHFFDHCLGVNSPQSTQATVLATEEPESIKWCNLSSYVQMLDRGRQHAMTEWAIPEDSIVAGEASPGYFPFPELPTLVNTIFPHTKLVVMLREPIARAFSGYLQSHTAWRGIAFEEAIKRELAIIRACEVMYPTTDTTRYTECIWPWFVAEVMEHSLESDFTGNRGGEYEAQPKRRCTAGMLRKQSIVIRGLYVYQLRLWLERFGASKIFVLPSEQYYTDTEATLATVRQFLGGRAAFNASVAQAAGDAERNSRIRGRKLDPQSKKVLQNVYSPYNEMLAHTLEEYELGNVSWQFQPSKSR